MRAITAVIMGSLIATSLGCAMCANPHYCKYAAYGGCRPRADMVHGRVGSVIDPAREANPKYATVRPGPAPASPSLLESAEPIPTPADSDTLDESEGGATSAETDALDDTTFEEFLRTPVLEVAEKPTLQLSPPKGDDVDVGSFLE